MPYTTGNPNDTARGLEIIISNFEHMLTGITDVKIPELLWPDSVPRESIDTSVNPGAVVASYRVRDIRGKGDFVGKMGGNVAPVGMTMRKVTVPIEASATRSSVTTQDIREFRQGFTDVGDLMSELGGIMRKASERHIEGTFFFGVPELNYNGYIDYPGVPVAQAALNAGATSRNWVDKTPDEILADINGALTTIWSDSKTIHVPDVVELPPEQYAALTALKAGTNANDFTVMTYIKRNNIYTNLTGNELTIKPLRYLQGGGAGGTDRMRVVTFQPENYWMPMPLPLTLLEPQRNMLQIDTYAEYIFSALHIKFPLSQISIDEI